MTNVFKKPARKLLLNQLRQLIAYNDLHFLKLKENKEIEVVQVWLEGKIESIMVPDIFLMDDGTGKARIKYANIANDNFLIEIGKYVTVIGIIEDIESNAPIIEAVKVTPSPITDNTKAKELWKLEVSHFWNFMQINS